MTDLATYTTNDTQEIHYMTTEGMRFNPGSGFSRRDNKRARASAGLLSIINFKTLTTSGLVARPYVPYTKFFFLFRLL